MDATIYKPATMAHVAEAGGDRGKQVNDDGAFHLYICTIDHHTRLLPTHTAMSDPDQQISDAEKMRLKRLARLGGSSTPSPAQQPSSITDRIPEVSETSTPREQPSANSRLLNLRTESAEPDTQGGPSSSSSSATSVAAKPVKSSSPSPALLGKRPSSAATAPRPPQQPSEPSRPTAAPPRLSIPYPEWEAQRVQAVFSVTLKVGPSHVAAS